MRKHFRESAENYDVHRGMLSVPLSAKCIGGKPFGAGIPKREENMNITDVRVRKVTRSGKMKAVVSITIDDVFVVHDIKVIEGDKGLFIAMPSRKAADGEYKDIAHPINSETRNELQDLILRRFKEAMEAEETDEL